MNLSQEVFVRLHEVNQGRRELEMETIFSKIEEDSSNPPNTAVEVAATADMRNRPLLRHVCASVPSLLSCSKEKPRANFD